MNTMMKYAALNEARKRDRRGRYTSENENEMRMEYQQNSNIDDKFRDRRGRERYDDGRFAPRNEMTESRYEMRGNMYDGETSQPSGNAERANGNDYGATDYSPSARHGHEMQLIGFGSRAERRSPPKGDEEERHKGKAERPHSSSNIVRMMDKEIAEEWMSKLQNADGSKGAKWSFEQAKQFMQQKGIEADPLEFWVTLNMMYSDYSAVGKKFSLPSPDFYAFLADAFLNDEDSQEEKLSRYYACIVK